MYTKTLNNHPLKIILIEDQSIPETCILYTIWNINIVTMSTKKNPANNVDILVLVAYKTNISSNEIPNISIKWWWNQKKKRILYLWIEN